MRLLSFLLVTLLLGACSEDPASLFEAAKSKRSKGDRAGAVILLKNAIQAEPNNPSMRHALGQIYLELRDGSAAEKEIRKAIELGGKNRSALAADLAQALWMQAKLTTLLSDVAIPQGAESDKESLLKIHSFRGRAQAYFGVLSEANQSLEAAKALSGDTRSPPLALLEAQILSRERKFTEAIRSLDGILERQPRHYDALLVKADLLRTSGATDEALTELGRLLGFYPADLNALVGRSSLYMQKAKWDLAEKDIEALRKHHQDHYITLFQDGLLRFRRGQFRLALESFQTALKRNPNLDLAALYLGMSQMAVGEPRQAEKVFSIYLKDHPDDRLARQMLASVLVDLNEPTRALEVVTPVLEGGKASADFYSLAAEAYSKLGEQEKAIELFGKAAELSRAGSLADERRAIMRLAAGQSEAALDDFQRIAKARKGISNADIALVFGNLRRDPAHALALIGDLEQKYPGQPFLINLRGVALLQKGDKQAARAVFEEALKKQPSFLPAAANLFRLDIEQKNLERARQRFISVLEAEPNHYQALLALAEVEQTSSKPADAIPLLKKAASVHPNEIEPRKRLVPMLLRRGDKDEALQVAQDFVNRNAKSFEGLELLGKVQLSRGDANAAIATYTRLTTEYPKTERAYLALAEAQLQSQRPDDAERSLRRILAINPEHREGRLAWVGLMVKEKRTDEAQRYAQQLQRDSPRSVDGWILEAELMWARARFADAAKLFRTALSMAPRDELAIRGSQALEKAGDPKSARAELQKFVDQHPKALLARAYLAEVRLRSGDYAAAAITYEPVLSAPGVTPTVLNNAAFAYFKINDPRALGIAERAHRAAPGNPLILDTLAMILLREGDATRARGLLETAASSAPNRPEIRYRYAVALHKTGDKERARAELTELLSKHKEFAEREEAGALLKTLGG